jgi:RNA polymerase sigma factor (sigma-70 family)
VGHRFGAPRPSDGKPGLARQAYLDTDTAAQLPRNGIPVTRQLAIVNEITTERDRPSEVSDPRAGPVARFEQVYRDHVQQVTAYFARRTADPQTVADLTADTFVQAIMSFATFDPARGSPRGWIFGIARRVFARYCEHTSRGRDVVARLAGRRELDIDEAAELVVRIDAERAGRTLVDGMAALARTDREVIELVDIAGLDHKEAAVALGISSGALRIRLFRARSKLRRIAGEDNG